MKQLLEQSDLLIFDLDGTLYEDTAHFDYYASQLIQHVSEDQQEEFKREYEAIKEGNHVVSIGKAYDVKRDNVLTLDPMTLDVTEVHSWDGQLLKPAKVKELYSDELTFDFERMIAIGDGWWLPFVTAKHFGVEDTYSSYMKTKEYMVTDRFQLTKTSGLKNALSSLKEKKTIVLMTNSDRDDVGRLLKELELEGLFTEIIPSAQKPVHTVSYFKEIMSNYNATCARTVSIGDNFINEIAPALKLGMKAVYIHSHGTEVDHENLVVIKTMANAL
jgi:FMN phosphatase YigB (HAD superfamily)